MPEISLPLYHQEQGDPTLPCLVILHGLFGASVNFTSLAKTLSEHYRVIRFDLPNHGRSPHTEQHTYPIMADAVTTSLAALGVERCCVLGHSMGGKVAMQLAAAQPNLVERLIVVDIAPVQYPEDSHRDVLTAMAAVAAAAARVAGSGGIAPGPGRICSRQENRGVRSKVSRQATRAKQGNAR